MYIFEIIIELQTLFEQEVECVYIHIVKHSNFNMTVRRKDFFRRKSLKDTIDVLQQQKYKTNIKI